MDLSWFLFSFNGRINRKPYWIFLVLMVVLLAAVGLAVAALTAVGFLTERIGKAVARQANEVLAADLRLRSQAPVPDEWRELAAEYDLQTADTLTFPSVVFFGDDNALSSIKVVSERYPLRGAVRVALSSDWT